MYISACQWDFPKIDFFCSYEISMALQPRRLNQLLNQIKNCPGNMPPIWSWGSVKPNDYVNKKTNVKGQKFQNLKVSWSFGRLPGSSCKD